MSGLLSIPEKAYKAIVAHLLPRRANEEEAGFVFAVNSRALDGIRLDYVDWYPIPEDEFLLQARAHIELTDESRAGIIKRAHDMGSTLVEFHSHPWQTKPRFSPSDLIGLDEFVPHVMWRLKNRPYAAVVISPVGFDALIWTKNPNRPETLNALRVGETTLLPTGLTLSQREYAFED